MKAIYTYLLGALLLLPLFGFIWSQSPDSVADTQTDISIIGAWEVAEVNGQAIPEDAAEKTVRIISEDYSMFAVYNLTDQQFMGAGGGAYKIEGNTLTGGIDFDTNDTANVGQEYTLQVEMVGDDKFKVTGETPDGEIIIVMKRIDDSSNDMAGAYRISGRYRNGEMRQSRPGPRKTIKMLSGTRFQWAAINAKTKQFFGTGGGTYTVKDGKYTEHIEFFSRDGSRVGASLEFEASLNGDDWSHKGKSSKGNPIHEIWTRNWNLHD